MVSAVMALHEAAEAGQVVGELAHLCHPCKANHTHAERYPTGKRNKGRNDGLNMQRRDSNSSHSIVT